MNIPLPKWYEANQRYLSAALLVVRQSMKLKAARSREDEGGVHLALKQLEDARRAMEDARARMPEASALESLSSSFGLTPFERDLLLLCADVELDACFLSSGVGVEGSKQPGADQRKDVERCYPTFGQALAALPGSHLSAISPGSPLRRWRLIEVGPGNTLTSSTLRIDERVLHHLAGVSDLDQRFEGLVRRVRSRDPLPLSHQKLADRIADIWSGKREPLEYPAVQLCGNDHAEKISIAAMACESLGVCLYAVGSQDIPSDPREREELACLWEREFLLEGAALLVDCDDGMLPGQVLSFLEKLEAKVVILAPGPLPIRRRSTLRIDVDRPGPWEQRVLWERELGDVALELDGHIDEVVVQFNLDRKGVQAASREVVSRYVRGDEDPASLLWEACRSQARPRLEGLGQLIEPVAIWDDLVLPEEQQRVLREVAAQVRQRSRVYERWGFATKNNRGLGISALFSGASGTGKTMAAEVLAGELDLDLYRIDLSQVVNKYIGETEKNLKKVFDAAEDCGAILLFDEADALFGKRSEVKDSHDRFANIEIGYLLQRMEAYRGLAILTTNMKGALDQAFLRRIRFVVEFPFPDVKLRARIWERVFPDATPRVGIDYQKLARLNLAGGNIRNIALYSAFLAADEGEPVGPEHLERAARVEYGKIERSLTKKEMGAFS